MTHIYPYTKTDPDDPPNGYGWTISWNDNPAMPSGPYTSTLTLNYPVDPEWGAGSVSKSINLQFDHGGQQHFLAAIDGWDWDSVYVPSGSRVFDPDIPWTVSPGASAGALPKSVNQPDPLLPQTQIDGARAAFIIGKATFTPARPTRVFSTGATGDPAVEVVDNPAFRVSLVDGNNQLATDASFQVHLCPRYDHFAPPPDYQPRQCTTAPVQSSGGVIPQPVRINANGSGAADSQGYMGVELLTAPSNPGTYYIKFEASTGNTYPYRIREEGDIFWDKTPAGEYQGAFAFVTVVGTELLNESFQRFDTTLNISVDRVAYVRELDLSETADSHQLDLVFEDEDTHVETTLQNVTMRRLGRSSTFMSDAISIVSPDPPLQPLSVRPTTEAISESLVGRLSLRSLAGTLAPGPGLYQVKSRRNRSGTVTNTKLHHAATRLVEIRLATPNFDGVTDGRSLTDPGPLPIRRNRIEAKVKYGKDGYIAARLTNVGDPRIFTFDYWNDGGQIQQLTTPLIGAQSLLMGPGQSGQLGQELVIPAGPAFQALVGGWAVDPGLYKIRAQWGKTQPAAEAPSEDFVCHTDKPEFPVCVNEWVVSVGERILLTIDDDAKAGGDFENLTTYLNTVQAPNPPALNRTPDEFLRDVAARATSTFAAVGANVLVSTDPQILQPTAPPLLRPYMTHRIRKHMTSIDCDALLTLVYGCTTLTSKFPLLEPNLDLAVTGGQGISLFQAYHAPAPDNAHIHDPLQPRNATADTWSPANPSPSDIFLNRLANLVTHEMGHGFGLMSGKDYPIHFPSSGPTASMKAVKANVFMNVYFETPITGDHGEEPVLNPSPYPYTDPVGQTLLMQAGPYRWKDLDPTKISDYLAGDPPTPNWQCFDRPMTFSKSSYFPGTQPDYSIERFFWERLPVCTEGARECR